jgi:hypothetical protein
MMGLEPTTFCMATGPRVFPAVPLVPETAQLSHFSGLRQVDVSPSVPGGRLQQISIRLFLPGACPSGVLAAVS